MVIRSGLIAAAFALLASTLASAAQWEYSTQWCARMATGVEDCAYYTLAQCRATISGEGGTCHLNPLFIPRETVMRPRPRGSRK